MGLKIRSLMLKNSRFDNWESQVLDHWDYMDFVNQEKWRKDWISFDCAFYNQDDDRVYTGITSFDADIFKAYDRKTNKFVDLNYSHIANRFDAKFHRSLVKGTDGCLYAAIALLHDSDRFMEAPGSAIVKYDPKSGTITKMGIPLPHVYVQSMVIDNSRHMLYLCCFAPEKLLSFNLRTGEVCDYGLINSGYGGMAQGENIVLDDTGCVWCNWMLTRAWQMAPGPDVVRFCKIDPNLNKIVFLQKGLPLPDGGHGYAKAEAYFNFHNGYLYASGANGSLFRIDPLSGDAKYLFTPIKERRSRLAAMTIAPDGYAYGVTGRDGQCELLRFDFKTETYELMGPVIDENGEPCFQVHDITVTADQTFYACENDNIYRSSRLWEIRIK